jgi:MFS family permease
LFECSSPNVEVGFTEALVIMPLIAESFNITNAGTLSWMISGYSLTVGTFILFSGRLGDLFGYKRMLIIGYLWFSLWTMIAGVAVYSNHVLFIFARVIGGIGPAICMPNGLALLGITYAPGIRKNICFAVFGACAPTGSIIGAAFTALFSLIWWPWAFWSFSIALLITAVLAYLVIPNPPKRTAMSVKEKMRHMDIPGAVIGVASLVLINFAWNQAIVVGWEKPYVYVCLIMGFLLIPAFFYYELRVSTAPLIPFYCLTADVGFVLAAVGLGWACFGIWVYYLYQFLQVLQGASPLLTVAKLSPIPVAGTLAAIGTGIALTKLGPAWTMTLALTFFMVGTILLATCPINQVYWGQIFFCTIITPFGMDMSFPAATVVLSNAVSKEHQGIAASLVATVVNYGISIGLGFGGTVEIHTSNGGNTLADLLSGYRGAEYMGIGLAGLGWIISVLFLVREHRIAGRERRSIKQKAEA